MAYKTTLDTRPASQCNFWTKSYIIDYILLLIFLGLIGVFFLGVNPIRPDLRWIYENRYEQYNKPYVPLLSNRCSPTTCMAPIALLPPAFLIILFAAVRKDLHEFHHGAMGILLTIGVNVLLWALFIRTSGKPRPDFFQRCIYDYDTNTCTPNPALETDGLTNLVEDGYSSFPSGHSALVCSCLTWSTLFLIGKRNPFRGRGNLLVIAWLIAAIFATYWVGWTRYLDNRHDPFDIIVGTLLGLLVGFITYPIYYPWPFGPTPSRPYSIAKPHRAWEYVFGRSTRGDPRYVWEPYAPDESAPTLLVKPIGTGIPGKNQAVNLPHGRGGADVGDYGDDVEMARTKQPYPESAAPTPADLKVTTGANPGAVKTDAVAEV